MPATIHGAQAQDVRTVHGTASSTGIEQFIEYAECGCDAGNCEAFVFVRALTDINFCTCPFVIFFIFFIFFD
jgi:hypothetical protein